MVGARVNSGDGFQGDNGIYIGVVQGIPTEGQGSGNGSRRGSRGIDHNFAISA